MNELKIIQPTVSKKIKILVLVAAIYLFVVSAMVSVTSYASSGEFKFYFFMGIVGLLVAAILFLSVTVWKPKPIIVITNEAFGLHLPKQRVDGVIAWGEVASVGIGLSYLTLGTTEDKQYKIDLENLKYREILAIKTRLIEICESKNIPYSNL